MERSARCARCARLCLCEGPARSRSPRRGPLYGMKVFVKLPTGATISWIADECCTIGDMKTEIETKKAIPVDQQKLVLEVEDDRILAEPYRRTDNELHLLLLPRYA